MLDLNFTLHNVLWVLAAIGFAHINENPAMTAVAAVGTIGIIGTGIVQFINQQ